ncbi:RING finger protein unkempt [Echinococcus granulosus]|nr:RING finger protein unkempt [Echinococcus granulosus]
MTISNDRKLKRRRPIKKVDGTFNYNPDVYCDKYDENSGTCPDGDDCPYAHRNAGDTERRYHPRYFKTGNCIYETTESGACVKNGLHCAFAHGPDDLRLPVYDIREVQDASSSKVTVNLPASLEKERVLSEDPTWNDMLHVMARYKTESCRKPPRMCRQGYSCPYYHNGKDKRRMPERYFYRSTPCPAVRPADEWLDSALCDAGDACTFCHTRTEQQFHPEIYKSTKCNDVLNSGYCPRGPFCAFAHADSEMTLGRTFLQSAPAASCGLSASSPRQHDASPVSSSTSASSSGVFSPGIRSSVPALTSLQASHTYPTGGQKLRMRHRSGGAAGSADSGGFGGATFDLQDTTPPPSVAAVAGAPAPPTQPSMLPHFPLFSPLIGAFGRGAFNTATRTTATGGTASTSTASTAAGTAQQQGSAARRKVSMEANKFPRMRLESCGSMLESYARGFTTPSSSSSSLTNQQPGQQQQHQQQRTGCVRSLGKCSPQPVTPSSSSSISSSMPTTFKSLPPWWAGAEVSERQQQQQQHHLHHPDNEYLNSLVTEELRTQLTVSTSPEESHQQQLIKDFTQSPLSCLLRQVQLSNQQAAAGAASTLTGTKRGSGLFDDDPLGVVTASPLASPRGAPAVPPPSHQPSTAVAVAAATTATSVSGCSASAPVCIPSNGGNRGDIEAFDFPCSCGCCCRGQGGGGQDSAFNSGGTPTVICDFGAVGSTSLHSMTSEGQDSALALSEVKDDGTPDLPLLHDASGTFGSMLLANVYQAQSLLPNHPASTTTSATTAAAVAGTMTSTAATTGLGDVDKTNTFSLPTTQSPVLLHSSPFSTTTAPDLERLALRQELEETRCKLNASLQDLEALRCECAEQTQQTLGLQLVVRQIVMILFNHLAEVRRLQEKPPLTPPSATATGTTTPSSARDASLTFLNDLLRVLLYDPTVRSALSSDGITGSTGASTTTPAASVTKRPSSLRRKSCSNPPGSWSGGGVLEDLEEEDQSRLGAMEESTSFEDDLRLTLFSSSHHHRQHHHHHQQHQHAIEHSSSVGNINNNGNSNILNP